METTTEEIKIACPHCGQHYAVEATMLGASIECQQCGKAFVVERPSRADDPEPETSPGSQPDSMSGPEAAPEVVPEAAPEPPLQEEEGRRPSFVARAKAAVRRTGERAIPLLVRSAAWSYGFAARAAGRLKPLLDSPKRRKWAIAGAGVLLLAVCFGSCGDKGVVLPLEEIAKAAAKWHHTTATEPAPRVVGSTLEFASRQNVGAFEIPSDQQSRRISFDFRSTGTTGWERGYTSIHLFTCGNADAVFVTVRDEGVFVGSRRDGSDKAVKVLGPSSRWKHVEAVMKPGETVVSVSGKKIVFPAMEGGRWASFSFTILKPNLQMRNVRSFPSKEDRDKAKEEKRLAEEKRKRDKEHAEYQRSRGLVLVDGEWMTPGSRRNISLSVMQKLLNKGFTMMRAPMDGEHGGLLCVDSSGGVGCIIVSEDKWHNAVEDRTYRFDIYRCGIYSYTTTQGKKNTVPLFATDLDTALEELDGGEYSERFK